MLVTYLIANLAIFGPPAHRIWVTPEGWLEWALIVWIGVAAALGQAALILAFRMAPASIVAPMQYTQLIWGIAFGALLFGDAPDFAMIAGALLIIVGGGFTRR